MGSCTSQVDEKEKPNQLLVEENGKSIQQQAAYNWEVWDVWVRHYHATLNRGYDKVLWNWNDKGEIQVVGGAKYVNDVLEKHVFSETERAAIFGQLLHNTATT